VMTGPELPALIEADRQPTEKAAIAAIDFLLDHGVKPGIANDLGTTALHMAALRDYPGVIRHMAERGADLNVGDREGFTPLDYAMGRMPSRVRAKAPGADAAVAVALRELGARGKDEQRTAAR
jgi:ankyrin repeat protein